MQTRTWFPCVDKQDQRCTWEMQWIVPRTLVGPPSKPELYDTIVVSSGYLVKQVDLFALYHTHTHVYTV